MKIPGETAITLAVGIAAGLLVLYAVRQLQSALSSAATIPERVWDATKGAFVDAYDAAVSPRAGTDGWQFFPMEGVAIDAQGNYWMGTKMIWKNPN